MIKLMDYFRYFLLGILSCGLLLTFNSVAAKEPVALKQAFELKNRFRVDHMIDSMTLFIERSYGTSPVIIVLPDGSKWYKTRHPDNVKWQAGESGDMITIPDPMAGPWQLIGQIRQGSTIQKFSALSIELDPVPQPLFQGEELKISARLKGDGKQIRFAGLDYLINWKVQLQPFTQAQSSVKKTRPIAIGRYRDDGQLLDETPDDNEFTSRFNLNHPWGDYMFVATASNAVFSREFKQAIILSKLPINVSVLAPDDRLTQPWKLAIEIHDQRLNLARTHIMAELSGPNNLKVTLPIKEINQIEFTHELPELSEPGSYTVSMKAASTIDNGREILIHLPRIVFDILPIPVVIPPPTEEELAAKALIEAKAAEASAKKSSLILIISVSSILFIVGCIALFLMLRKKQKVEEEVIEDEIPEPKAVIKQIDEIDLSMPDEAEMN